MKRLALTLYSDARNRSSAPDKHSSTIAPTATIALPGPRLNNPASTPPTMMLASSAQKMKNFVLSHTHGCSTMTFGTTNHSHIGANQLGNAVGNHRGTKCPTTTSGTSKEVFQIQNPMKSAGNSHTPLRCQSVNVSHPGWTQ